MTEQEIRRMNYTYGGNNYVLLGNTKWIAFTKNVIEKKIKPKFGLDFNLIIYWYNADGGIDYIKVPYKRVSHLFTDEHITGKGTPRERWNFIIKDNLLCVHANTYYSIDIMPYLHKM
ncbi:MAG: hypothetical protein NC095_04450 [Muribaculum sp.]|nr:hypothetical protein [Muribaculum sp.]